MGNHYSNIFCLKGRQYDLFKANKEFSFKDEAKECTCFGKYIAVTSPDKSLLPTPCMLAIIGEDLRTSYIAFMPEEKSKEEFLDWINQLSFGKSIIFKGVI